ncbi:MAG: copper-binding protein [Phycisphaerales bacterium]|nr:copper-binding protein [Phycisphaerales bacterium]
MTPSLRAAAIAAAAIALAALPACKRTPGKAAPPADDSVKTYSYTVRGQVRQLPQEGNMQSDFMVFHEAIPEFKGPKGSLGMDVMEMPFPLADDVTLEGLRVGDKVRLTFVVRFDARLDVPRGYEATRIEKLPPDTRLDFTPLTRPAPAPGRAAPPPPAPVPPTGPGS